MRLWHKDLIEVLPRQQLLGQWRECCAIAKSIAEKGTPNHVLVNKIMDYPLEHFGTYAMYIGNEMLNRGYKCDFSKFDKYLTLGGCKVENIFKDWHNERYLKQCVFNLQEKYDCGAISNLEWRTIVDNLFTEKGVVIF